MGTKALREVLVHKAHTVGGGGPPSPPVPVPATAPAVPGAGVAELRARRQNPLSGTRRACALPPGGMGPSTWPVPALELLFRALNIADLLVCCHVCRHWRQVAMDPRLQRHCLLQTWPAWHRRRLESALDTAVVRASLTPWCDSPAARPVKESSAAAAALPSPQELLLTAVQRMLLTDRIHPGAVELSPRRPGRIPALVFSAEGRLMASAAQFPAWEVPQCSATLWRWGSASALSAAHSTWLGGDLELLALSSDQRRLRGLFRAGWVQVWRPDARVDTVLRRELRVRLFEDVVHKAVLSADGRYLGVATRGRVLIYGEDAQGSWAVPPVWSEVLSRRARSAYYDPAQVGMLFSDDNRHFVCARGWRAFVCTQEAEGWRKQPLELYDTVRGQPALDARGCLLALAYGCDGDQGWSAPGGIHFWRFEEPPSAWRALVFSGCGYALPIRIHSDAVYSVPMAFSPDCQLVAVPDWCNCQCLRVIPVSGPGAWAVQFRLKPAVENAQPDVQERVSCVQFSANSCYLAVRAGRALTLWRRLPDRWSPLMRLSDPLRQDAVPFALSPDGFHCVASRLSEKGQEQVSIWGPVSTGQYRRKYLGEVPQGFTIEKVQFTPDGTRVLAVGYGRQFREVRWPAGDGSEESRIVSRFFCWNLVPRRRATPTVKPQPSTQGPAPG